MYNPFDKTNDRTCALIDDVSGSRSFYIGEGFYFKEKESLISYYLKILKSKIFFWKKIKVTRKISDWKFYIKDFKSEAPLPPNCSILIEKGKKVPFFYRALNGKVSYCDVEIDKTNTKGIKQIEPDIALWGNQARKKVVVTYSIKNFWDKYGDTIVFFGAATLSLVLVYLLLKKIDVIQEGARLFSESVSTLKSSSIINSTTGAP
jgi:hypothetical protein